MASRDGGRSFWDKKNIRTKNRVKGEGSGEEANSQDGRVRRWTMAVQVRETRRQGEERGEEKVQHGRKTVRGKARK